MKTIVFASQKGGSGKSTLTAQVSVAATEAGAGPVILIDADRQGSLAAWWNEREATSPEFIAPQFDEIASCKELLEKNGYEYLFIDTPPSASTNIEGIIDIADIVVIPVKPSPNDLRAVGKTVSIVKSKNKQFIFVLNQAKPNANITLDALSVLSEHGTVSRTVVYDRVEFASSMIDGSSVLEDNKNGKSAAEMRGLWKYISERI